MTQLPDDPMMLLSTVNMLLRDGNYDTLGDLAAAYSTTADAIISKLEHIGFEWNEEQKRFW